MGWCKNKTKAFCFSSLALHTHPTLCVLVCVIFLGNWGPTNCWMVMGHFRRSEPGHRVSKCAWRYKIRAWLFCLDQNLSNYGLQAKSNCALTVLNKALLEHGHARVLTHLLSMADFVLLWHLCYYRAPVAPEPKTFTVRLHTEEVCWPRLRLLCRVSPWLRSSCRRSLRNHLCLIVQMRRWMPIFSQLA